MVWRQEMTACGGHQWLWVVEKKGLGGVWREEK